MGKAIRKPRPSPPKYIWYSDLDDHCWRCKNRNACNNCKICKSYVTKQKQKRDRKEQQMLRNKVQTYD